MKGLRKGITFEQRFGSEKAKIVKVKISLGKKGSTFHWNKPHPKGKEHPRYIIDRTQLARKDERNDSAYNDWRKQVWLRDSFKCRINIDCSGKIEAHHILIWKDYPELRYNINNGITLCHAHHPRKRAEEKRLAPIFQELVSVSKVYN